MGKIHGFTWRQKLWTWPHCHNALKNNYNICVAVLKRKYKSKIKMQTRWRRHENISKKMSVDENTYWKLVWQNVQPTVLTIWNSIKRQFYSNLKWREVGLKTNPIFAMLLWSNKTMQIHAVKSFTLPLTISWAKLDTPEPSSDWVTQRYKSWSAFVTSCNLKEAANRLWLMFFVWATGISSPFRLCKQKPIFKKKQVLNIPINLKHLSNQYLW